MRKNFIMTDETGAHMPSCPRDPTTPRASEFTALLEAPDFLQVPIDHKAPTGYSVDCMTSMVATG